MQIENQSRAVCRQDFSNQKTARAAEALVLAAYGIFIIKYFADISSLIEISTMIDNSFIAGILGLLIAKLFLQRYPSMRFFPTAAATVLLLASCVASRNNLYLISILFTVSLQDVSLRKLLTLVSSMKIALVIIHVFWYIVVYFTDPSSIQYVYRGGSSVPRHYFFMGHANMFTAFLTWIFLELIYLHYRKLNAIHLGGIWIVSLIFYRFTDSNTGIIVLFLITVLIAMDKLGGRASDRALFLIARYGHLVCSIFFPLTAVVFTRLSGGMRTAWFAINDAFSQRLWFGAYAYDVHGATIFGRLLRLTPKVFWGGRWFDNFAIFDNYYLGTFLVYGIIHLVAISLAFILITPKIDNRGKIIVVAYTFYGIMEAYVTNITICFGLLLIGEVLYRKSESPLLSEDGPPPAPVPLWKRPAYGNLKK